MTSATMRHARSSGGYREGYEMAIFAGSLVLMVGFFNLLDGIAAIANSHIYTANAQYVVGDLHTWGWLMTIFGGLQLVVGAGVMVGNQLARWCAVAMVGVNAVAQMFFIPAYPFWSLMIIAVDVVALWGLCAYGSRENIRSA